MFESEATTQVKFKPELPEISQEQMDYELALQRIAEVPLSLDFAKVRQTLADRQNAEAVADAPKVTANLIELHPEKMQSLYTAYLGFNKLSDSNDSLEIEAGSKAVLNAYENNPELYKKWEEAGRRPLPQLSDYAANVLFTQKLFKGYQKFTQDRMGLEEIAYPILDAVFTEGVISTLTPNFTANLIDPDRDMISNRFNSAMLWSDIEDFIEEKQRTLAPHDYQKWAYKTFMKLALNRNALGFRLGLNDSLQNEFFAAMTGKAETYDENFITGSDVKRMMSTQKAAKGDMGGLRKAMEKKPDEVLAEATGDIKKQKEIAQYEVETHNYPVAIQASYPSVVKPVNNLPIIYNDNSAIRIEANNLPVVPGETELERKFREFDYYDKYKNEDATIIDAEWYEIKPLEAPEEKMPLNYERKLEDLRDIDVAQDTGVDILYGPAYDPEAGFLSFDEALRDALRRRDDATVADYVELEQASREYFEGVPSLSKIGTGENGQYYGMGTYLSEYMGDRAAGTPARKWYLPMTHNSYRLNRAISDDVKTFMNSKTVEDNIQAIDYFVKVAKKYVKNDKLHSNSLATNANTFENLAHPSHTTKSKAFFYIMKPELVDGKIVFKNSVAGLKKFATLLQTGKDEARKDFVRLNNKFLSTGGLTIDKNYDKIYKAATPSEKKILQYLKGYFHDPSNFSQGTLKTFFMDQDVYNKFIDQRRFMDALPKDSRYLRQVKYQYDKIFGDALYDALKSLKTDEMKEEFAIHYSPYFKKSARDSIEEIKNQPYNKMLGTSMWTGHLPEYKEVDKLLRNFVFKDDPDVNEKIAEWWRKYGILGNRHAEQNMVLNTPELLRPAWASQRYKTPGQFGKWRRKYIVENPEFFFYPKKVGGKWFVAQRHGTKGFHITYDDTDLLGEF